MIVIFGSTGDLARRKLLPAIYRLYRQDGADGSQTPVICLGRSPLSRRQFLEHLDLKASLGGEEPDLLEAFEQLVHYLVFDLEAAHPGELRDRLEQLRQKTGCGPNILFYLALPNGLFARVAELVKPLLDGEGWRRVVFEKPFGDDLASARRLNDAITRVLEERQIYRADHYLGKELVQNLLFLRFANEIFACSWSREAIDSIQITVSEALGVGDRAGYYDRTGAIRDMLQNHLLQLLSLIAMEPPASEGQDNVRDEAARVLEALRPPRTEDIVLGQYHEGTVAGTHCRGYRQEDRVATDSTTETYVAMRAFIDSPRWRGVPFYLRTGKRLARRYAEINVLFKKPVLNGLAESGAANRIAIRIQPDEGIALAINVRKPGKPKTLESVLMDFCHHCHFGPNTPEAYETILAHVLRGDPILFTRWDWLEKSWRYIDALQAAAPEISSYPAGSEGPIEAERLLENDGRAWLRDVGRARSILPTAIDRRQP